ncbi:zinc ribbon domain-containing protein [Clostridium rectalis]|uniref:zinc ribbon domain-containing protein n=1 Tax=Clostridium rectalis TaxID=2040295 RepID=UPI0013DDCA3C|nr:C4-type zinc ribbon domain-containing protein [Clostridium rectalis]
MNNEKMLLELQNRYTKLEENYKVLKDKSYIVVLDSMKKKFNLLKNEYLNKKNKLEEINSRSFVINSEIDQIKVELDKDEFDLYNKYGNDIKMINNIQREIDEKKSIVKIKEDILINLLDREENLERDLKELKLKIEKIRNDFYKYKEDVNNNLKKCKNEYRSNKDSIDRITNKIPIEILKEFKEVRQRKKNAIALVENGVCTGCKVKISTKTIDDLNKKKEIVYCDNCGRILLLDNI